MFFFYFSAPSEVEKERALPPLPNTKENQEKKWQTRANKNDIIEGMQ